MDVVYPPRRSRRRKCALHRTHVLLPSLWFNAWRCKCSDLENDFPQSAKLQLNFFFISDSCDLELEVEEDETDEVLVLVGAMMRVISSANFFVGFVSCSQGGGGGCWEEIRKEGSEGGRGELWAYINASQQTLPDHFTYMIKHTIACTAVANPAKFSR